MNVLVVEDESDISDLIAYSLEREGYQVRTAASGEEALAAVKSDPPGVIVLDVMLPGINGFDVCRTLRRERATDSIPIIMLTARDDDIDIVTGLEIGADDYVTKPFSPKVLVARIRALLRRGRPDSSAGDGTEPLGIGGLTIDARRRRVTVEGTAVELTFTEFTLLQVLAERPGWVYSRSQLIDRLRDGQQVITDRAIDVQIANLRRKLGAGGRYIKTIRGVGYSLEAPE